MKVQQRHIKTITSKKAGRSQPSSTFQSIFSTHESSPNGIAHKGPEILNDKNHEAPEQPLKHILHELEDIMLNLEQDSKDYTRAQMAINSLRDALHDMPDAFPLTARDREEAKTLLVVESKRIDELQKYER
jgi:hypothetical protein